jgi:hypothetical protein
MSGSWATLEEPQTMNLRVLLSCLLGLMLAGPVVAAENRFESPTAGVTFNKPGSWVFVSAQAAQENRDKVRLNDTELEARMKTQANFPLAMVTKHPEPYPDINASFQLGFRPLGGFEGKSAVELIQVILTPLKAAYADFEVAEPVLSTTVGGLPAARVGIRYTLKTTDGGAFPTRSDLIVVPRGKFMFFIGMGRKPDDSEAEREQQAILSSLEIQP